MVREACGSTQARAVSRAEWYYRVLRNCGASVDIWRTVYHHLMLKGAADPVEWFKGTGLRPFLDPLDAREGGRFSSSIRPRSRRRIRHCPMAVQAASCFRDYSSWRRGVEMMASNLSVSKVGPEADGMALRNLIQHYCHDMAEWFELDTLADGSYPYDTARIWEPGRDVYLARLGESLAGFALLVGPGG